MTARISKTSAMLLLFAGALLLLVCWVIFSDVRVQSSARYGIESIISIGMWILMLAVVLLRDRKLSFYWVLLLVAYPFYFGQQLIAALGLETTRRMIDLGEISDDVAWSASFFVMTSFLVLTLSYILARSDKKRATHRVRAMMSDDGSSLRKACLVVAILLFVPTVHYMVSNISLNLSVGYGARISDPSFSSHGLSNVDGILAQIMPVALLGLIITKRPGEKWQVAALLCYFALYFASGSRSAIFSFIPVLAYVWVSLFSRKSVKAQLLYLLSVIIVIGVAFSFVSFIRGITVQSASTDMVPLISENNVIVDMLQEAGQTFVVTAAALAYIPEVIPFSNGLTYLSGLIYILPNQLTSSFYSTILSVDDLLSPFLVNYGGVGSSFIAEGYLNFGYFSVVIIMLYGFAIGRLTDYAEEQIEQGFLFGFFLSCSCFLYFSFYIRSDVRTFLRNFVWNVLPIVLIQQLFYAKAKRFASRRVKQDTVRTSSEDAKDKTTGRQEPLQRTQSVLHGK